MLKFADQLLTKGFNRRVMRSLSAMAIAAVLLLTVFAMIGAINQNQLAITASMQLAETALGVKQREIARNLEDYAYREDAYHNLHETFDYAWAAASGNIGSNIFASLGYEMAFVLSSERQTLYATIEGVPQSADAYQMLSEGLTTLVERGAQRISPAVGIVRSGDNVLLVAATAIRPHLTALDTTDGAKNSVLVFAKRLNGPLLTRIGSDYLLNRFRLIGESVPDLGASLPLFAFDGTLVGRVTWIPEQPGYENLRMLLPPMAGCFVIFGVFAFFAMRYARRSSVELQSSAETIDAYAETLRKSEARFRDVAEASSDWIWECDSRLQIFFVSARFKDVTGLSDAAAIGRAFQEFFDIDEDDAGWQPRSAAIVQQESFRDLKCRYRTAAGTLRICRVSARPIIDEAGLFDGYRGTAADITEEVEAQARAIHLSLHDILTGLPNRALFRENLKIACAAEAEQRDTIAVLCLDLDHFKEINDAFGHAVGDLVLQEVSVRLRDAIKPTDAIARLGGDEFAIIQFGAYQPMDSSALSRSIIEQLAKPFIVEGKDLHIGVSIGVALLDESSNPVALLKNADIALYRAKQAGRGTVRQFEPFMDLELQARRSLEHDLRQAVGRNEFVLHFQPLVRLETGQVAGVEALVRWQHPERGLVPPGEFIPMAEDTGLILPIGEWVLRTACHQASKWPGLIVAVNLSPIQFKHSNLVEVVRQALEDSDLPAHRLELEITESVLLHDSAAALDILTRLKETGARIAMDDFGTGYSSLGYLNSFPFDKIKIDRSFINDLSAVKSNAIVRSVIGLGQSLKMVITAEGVETVQQADFLRREGCEQVQGYLFSPPLPADQLTMLLDGWNDRAVVAA